jgi:hypothetical protein
MEHYDTTTLVGVIRGLDPAVTPYWLDLAFPRQITFDTEEIQFDMVTETRKLAPFVAPTHQGKVQSRKGFSAKSFRPAYIKPKDVLVPGRALTRMAGEALTGTLSAGARWNAHLAELLRLQREEITRRWDWMAARAVIDGSVTVSGDDYPTVNVDFGRHTDNTMTLTGTAQWDDSAANPLGNIETIRTTVRKRARAGVTRLTFGLDAWAEFIEDDNVQALLRNDVRNSPDTNFNARIGEGGPYESRGVLSGKGVGSLELYTYSDTYETDNDGTEADYLDPGWVVATGPGLQGVRCFGAIMDSAAGLAPMAMFPKMWPNQDPSVTYVMTQSAPLMVPAQPNGSAVIKTL